MEKIKTLAEVTLTQRTAVGHNTDDTTAVYIVSNYETSNNDVVALSAEDAQETVQYNRSTIVGKVLVHHPSLLWGTWEENYSRMCQSAMRAIEDIGLIVYNRYDTAFLK